MTTYSYQERPSNSMRHCRASIRRGDINPSGHNANDDLTHILNRLPINDLFELQDIESSKSNQISIAPKFGDFYRWKRKISSIHETDSIISLAINEAIKQREESKEEEPSPYNDITEDGMIKNKSFIDDDEADDDEDDDDEAEYDVAQDSELFLQELYNDNNNAKATKTALNKNANEYVPGFFGTLSGGNGDTKLGPIAEDKASETGSRPEIQCNGTNIPHSPSNSSLASVVSSNTAPGVLSPSVLTQPPSITNSPPPTIQSSPCTPPTPSTSMVDINPYLQDLQQLPIPVSYLQNSFAVNPNMAPLPANYVGIPSIPNLNPNMAPLSSGNYVPAVISPPGQPLAVYPMFVPLQPIPVMPISMSMPNNALFSVPQTAVSMPMPNHFDSNNNTATQPLPTQDTQQNNNSNPMNERQFAAQTTITFQAKFNNHAKGNFYISKEKIGEMISKAAEEFDTEEKNDEKLAFGHYKESVAMSINDKQIDAIFQTQDGKLMIIINIDLHFRSNPSDVMYLIATENDEQYRDRVRWCIVDFMSAQEILYKYKGITKADLPKSSRNMSWFKKGIDRAPIGFTQDEVQKMVRNTHFKTLPKKTSKRAKKNEKPVYKSRISQQRLKRYVEESLLDDVTFPVVPVVVIKGKNQCIEWKRFVQIEDDAGYIQYVGISLKFYEGNKQWKIECMDYDSGRVYYQHRLASLPVDSVHHYSYDQVSQCITTSLLDIYDANRRSNSYRNYNKNNNNNYKNYNCYNNRRYDSNFNGYQ